MRIITFLFFILFSFNVFGEVELRLIPGKNQVNQGEIFEATILLKTSESETVPKGLVGKHFAETVYIYSMEPFVVENGQLASKAKVIFSKIPSTQSVLESFEGRPYVLNWSGLEVLPILQGEGFKFGSFDLPISIPWLSLSIILVLLSIVLIFTYNLIQKNNFKRNRKKELLHLLNVLETAKNYSEIEGVWLKRDLYLSAFPNIENDFKKFEIILNRYQFKPMRSDTELNEISEAYEKFKNQLKGVRNGI